MRKKFSILVILMLQKVWFEYNCLEILGNSLSDGKKKKKSIRGLSRDLNPGPPAPKAGIIPLDH